MAGNSIKVITAIRCPPNACPCISKKLTADTNVTALTEPYDAAMAPALLMPTIFLRIKKRIDRYQGCEDGPKDD